jgi:phosphonate transport system substrate-binding protein
MKRFWGILTLCTLVVSLSGCSQASSPASTLASTPAPVPCVGPAITLGDISDNPNQVITSVSPLATYLAGRLAAFGFTCGNVRVPDTTDRMIAYIKNGEVDIYMDSMYPAFLVSQATGAQPILRRWRNCDPEYYSVIFTVAGSGITSIQDLPGHMIAMDRSYSTSGFALPATYLLDHGLNLAVKDRFDVPPAATEAGIYFSLDDVNTLNLVLEGKVSAGATDDYFLNQWDTEAPGRLVKLAQTGSMPRQAVLVRAGLGSDLRQAIKQELAAAHLNPAGLAALKNDADTCKFDDTPEGIGAAFAQMRAMHARLKEIPGWQDAFLKGH